MRVLRKFNKDFLSGLYPYSLLIDSHDTRLIDIGVLSKYPIVDVKTHIDDRENGEYIFSRDCLEVTFDTKKTPLTIFVNHLKSKIGGQKAADKRKIQAEKVADIIRERYKGKSFSDSAFAVVGDFNDRPDSEYVTPLVVDLGLENAIKRIPDKTDQWTHWWDTKKIVNQLDYILVSPRLANDSSGIPYIERRGISSKQQECSYLATPNDKKSTEEIDFTFKRLTGVTKEIEASDHCPVFFEIKL